MQPIEISLIAFAGIFGGTLLGMVLRKLLPEHHLSSDSKDVMKLGIGTIATLSALVLALLIGSAKGTFDSINSGLRQTGARIISLDQTMARYGPETKEAREVLRRVLTATIERIWPAERAVVDVEKAGQSGRGVEYLSEKIVQLTPHSDYQRQLQLRALEILGETAESNWLLVEHIGQRSFPMPLLVLLVCWLIIIFFSFGLFSSPNKTVIAVLFVCALAAASSLFLILELDQPFGGLIRVSSAPLLNALAHIGQ